MLTAVSPWQGGNSKVAGFRRIKSISPEAAASV